MTSTNFSKSVRLALLPAVGLAVLTFGISVSALADDKTDKPANETAKQVGHDVGEATRTVGHETKKATKTVGHTVRDATKATGHAVRDATKATGHAFRDGAKEFTNALQGEGEKSSASQDKSKSAEKPATPRK